MFRRKQAWLLIFALSAGPRLRAQTTTEGSSAPVAKKPTPSFSAAGIQGNIAPSGYSDGAREEKARQVATLIVALRTASMVEALPAESRLGCDRQPELLHRVLMEPESFRANQQLGLFYVQHQNLALATRYLAVAKEKQPTDLTTLRFLAEVQLQANDTVDASQLVAQLLKEAPQDATARRLHGALEAAEGHTEAARADYELAAKLDSNEDNLYSAALSLIVLGSFPEARSLLATATDAFPRSVRLWWATGMVEILKGEESAAAEALLRSAALDLRNGVAPTLLANLAHTPEQFARVLPVLEAFAKANPEKAIAHYDLALMLSKANRDPSDSPRLERVQVELKRGDSVTAELRGGALPARVG